MQMRVFQHQRVQAEDVQRGLHAVARKIEGEYHSPSLAAAEAAPQVAADARRRLEVAFDRQAGRLQHRQDAVGTRQQGELHVARRLDFLRDAKAFELQHGHQGMERLLGPHAGDGVAYRASGDMARKLALDQEVLRALLQRRVGMGRIGVAGHHHHRHGGGRVAHPPQGRHACRVRQAEVEQDRVERAALEGGERLGHGASQVDVESGLARGAERLPHQAGVAGVVLHQQHLQQPRRDWLALRQARQRTGTAATDQPGSPPTPFHFDQPGCPHPVCPP